MQLEKNVRQQQQPSNQTTLNKIPTNQPTNNSKTNQQLQLSFYRKIWPNLINILRYSDAAPA